MTIPDSIKKSKGPYTRKNPCLARFIKCTSLNKSGSSKENLHVVFDLEDPEITYEVGSSFGIFPENSPESVNEILSILDVSEMPIIFDPRSELHLPLSTFLKTHANLTQITSKHLELIQKYNPSNELQALLDDPQNKKAFFEVNDLFTFLTRFWTKEIPINELVSITSPLLPRYYSIASSQKQVGTEVHFMVASFSYFVNDRQRHSITAKHLKDECEENKTYVRMFLQENLHFKPPSNETTPMIMIGPGTGVAVFRGFLQDRFLTHPHSDNWLFTGDRERAFDFHYEDEFKAFESTGFLRLSAAFSRDKKEKVYVQHLMLQNSKELWSWISEGNAHIYICGDAKQMAKDVTQALVSIAEKEGKMSPDAAHHFIKELKTSKRLLLDVY